MAGKVFWVGKNNGVIADRQTKYWQAIVFKNRSFLLLLNNMFEIFFTYAVAVAD